MHGPTEQWVFHLWGGNHKEMEQGYKSCLGSNDGRFPVPLAMKILAIDRSPLARGTLILTHKSQGFFILNKSLKV